MTLIVFDIDGTLTESQSIDDVLYRTSLTAVFGFRNVNNDWGRYRHTTDTGILEELFEQRLQRLPSTDERQAFRTHFVNAVTQHAQHAPFMEVPGARRMLQELQATAGVQMAIATGGFADSARCKLKSAGFHPEAIPLASADDATARTAIMQAAIARATGQNAGTPYPHVIYVGDALWDARACRDLGLPFIGIGSGDHADRLRAEGARHVLADYSAGADPLLRHAQRDQP